MNLQESIDISVKQATHHIEYRIRLEQAYRLRHLNLHKAIHIAESTLEEQIIARNVLGEGHCKNLLGLLQVMNGRYPEAIDLLYQAESILCRYPEEELALCYVDYNKGLLFMRLGNFKQAYDYFEASYHRSISEQNGEQIAYSLFQLGVVSKEYGEYEHANQFLTDSLHTHKQNADQSGEAAALMQLGELQTLQGNTVEAEKLLKESIRVRNIKLDPRGFSANMNALGRLYLRLNDPITAEIYLRQGMNIATEQGDLIGRIIMMQPLGETLHKLGRTTSALDMLQHAIALAETGAQQTLHTLHFSLSGIFSDLGKHQQALEHYRLYSYFKEKNLNAEILNKFRFSEIQLQVETARRESEINRLRNVELNEAYKLVENKTKNIIDSLVYARQIQQTMQPAIEELIAVSSGAFLFSQPRDLVSGDFWWMQRIGDYLYLALADCTGHGVPGALLSMLGIAELNENVNAIIQAEPTHVLNGIRNAVIRSMHNAEQYQIQRDGMDMAFIRFHFPSRELLYSGANIPLVIIKNGELTELKADKQPIGHFHLNRPFSQHRIILEPGTRLYMCTDGFTDQFGGEFNRKFRHQGLLDLLRNIQHNNMTEQSLLLSQAFHQWKGDFEQTDDVCILGVEL